MCVQIRLTKTANPLRLISEIEVDEINELDEQGNDLGRGTRPADVRIKVSLWQNLPMAIKIHDDYLDTAIFKSKPLREVLGSWTPMGELMGYCILEDRPDDKIISSSTLLRHINTIKHLIDLAKTKTKTERPAEKSKTPDPWLGRESVSTVSLRRTRKIGPVPKL